MNNITDKRIYRFHYVDGYIDIEDTFFWYPALTFLYLFTSWIYISIISNLEK